MTETTTTRKPLAGVSNVLRLTPSSGGGNQPTNLETCGRGVAGKQQSLAESPLREPSSPDGLAEPKIVTVLERALSTALPALQERLVALNCVHVFCDATNAPSGSVYWAHQQTSFSLAAPERGAGSAPACEPLPRVSLVWQSAAVMRFATAGTLHPELAKARAAAQAWFHSFSRGSASQPGPNVTLEMPAGAPSACMVSLIVVGQTIAGLEHCLQAAQLELAISVRRAHHVHEVADILCASSAALTAGAAHGAGRRVGGRASLGGTAGEAFLAGLTSSDVLHNRGVPKGLRQSWLGALKQVLPEAAATAVALQYPSFRQLHIYLRRADRSRIHTCQSSNASAHASFIGDLADVRVGSKRLGPARSLRLYRILMATHSEASSDI